MSGIKTIGQVTAYKAVRDCNMEELAARQISIKPSGGIQFARTPDRLKKDAARDLVLEMFAPHRWQGPLKILTMPGVDWLFERRLLGMREVGWMTRLKRPNRTSIISIENDRTIYYAAVADMPGLHTRNALTRSKNPPPFAEHSVETRFIKRFYFGNVDDLIQHTWELNTYSTWDAAWLDYTGPLTSKRMRAIEHFYNVSVQHTLVVTALRARWPKETTLAIELAGGYQPWLCKHLPGEVLHYIEYNDTVAMAQFAVHKVLGEGNVL